MGVHQRPFLLIPASGGHGEGGGGGQRDELGVFMIPAGALVQFQMLHGEAALRNLQLILNTQLAGVLAGDIHIGADINDFEVVVSQLLFVPLGHLSNHFPGHDSLAQAHLIGKQDTVLPSAKDLHDAVCCGLLKILWLHLRRLLAACSNWA